MITKLIVECSGGVVTAIYGNEKLEVTLVDWDNLAEGDQPSAFQVAPLASLPNETRIVTEGH